jgi:hypothetical protein
VSSVSFLQANLQHSIAASSVLSRTMVVKGIHMALIQEPWIREGRIMGLNIPGYTRFCGSRTDRREHVSWLRTGTYGCYQGSLSGTW